MTTEEKIEVMQTFCGGKIIDSPLWDWINMNYKIEEKPKYIPFDFTDAEYLIGKVVKTKEDYFIGLITYISKTTIVISDTRTNFERLFIDCVFLDGSPCGKLKQ